MKRRDDTIGIYVHIPFCVRKCAYCDFLSFNADADMHNAYVNSLCKQIDAAGDNRPVASVYIGGGTPSSIDSKRIVEILCKLKERFVILPEAEITIEANPGTVTRESLKTYKDAGINRLSIGLQSSDDNELKLLGRIHSFSDFILAYNTAREVGFDNINVDIMTALPNQNADILNSTLDKVLSLKPEHVSAYSLIIEEGTPFYERYGENGVMGVEDERALFYLCRDRLKNAGYEHYEISNFSIPGYFSRHNTSYWTRRDYYGFGLGASSLINGHRIKNETDIEKYINNPQLICEDIALSPEDEMEEYMFLGLRMLKGVSIREFNELFDADYKTLYGKITDKLVSDGLLKNDGDIICLTEKGLDYGNYVFSSFLLEN